MNIMEEKVSKIWSILSFYMESAAECMSKLLNYVQSNSMEQEMEQAKAFIFHIEVLFNALNEIESRMKQFNESTALQYLNEPRELVRKILYFFSTLTHSTAVHYDYMNDFLPLINLLSQTLKILIRTALICAINLVNIFFFFFFYELMNDIRGIHIIFIYYIPYMFIYIYILLFLFNYFKSYYFNNILYININFK